MHAIRRLAVVLPLGLVLLLSACGSRSTLTAAPGACKGYNPQKPPVLQEYIYNGDEPQVHFTIPANSTLIVAADDPAGRGQWYMVLQAPAGGGTIAVPAAGSMGVRTDVERIVVVDDTNVKPALEWLIVKAWKSGVGVFNEYNQDFNGDHQESAGYHFGLNPCVDHLDE